VLARAHFIRAGTHSPRREGDPAALRSGKGSYSAAHSAHKRKLGTAGLVCGARVSCESQKLTELDENEYHKSTYAEGETGRYIHLISKGFV